MARRIPPYLPIAAASTFVATWVLTPAIRPESPASPAQQAAAAAAAASVWYSGCDEVRAAGKAPLYRGQPGYRPDMDGDDDGIACEAHRRSVW